MKRLLQWWTGTSLVLRILGGLVIGAVLGLTVPQWTGIGILGQVFVSALKAIAPVLVMLLVAASIAKAHGGLGDRFRTVITLYLVSTFVAAVIAVVGSFLFPVTIRLQGVTEGGNAAPGGLADVFTTLLTNMVMNPVQALASANYIGILFWAIIMGLALKMLASQGTVKVISDLADVVSQVVKWVIQFAPFGILGLVFSSVSESGLEIFVDYGKLILVLVGCMVFTSAVVNPFIAWLHLRKNPYPLYWKCLKKSGFNAFFTRSFRGEYPHQHGTLRGTGAGRRVLQREHSAGLYGQYERCGGDDHGPEPGRRPYPGHRGEFCVGPVPESHRHPGRLRRFRRGGRIAAAGPDGLFVLRHRQ